MELPTQEDIDSGKGDYEISQFIKPSSSGPSVDDEDDEDDRRFLLRTLLRDLICMCAMSSESESL